MFSNFYHTKANRIKNATVALLFFATYAVSAVAPLVVVPSAQAAYTCVVDQQGANDDPGQKDLTQMCLDSSGLPSTYLVKWSWDKTSWSGNNTGDACALFDTDNDGFANYAACLSVGGSPASVTAGYPAVYTCNDTRPDRCSGQSLVSASGVSCTLALQSPQVFAAGEDAPNDLQATCTIQTSSVGGGTSTLLDVCTIPSQQSNSDPSDCIMYRPKSGKLEVQKVLDVAGDTFNLQVDGSTLATGGNGTTTGETVVNEGAHTVGETAATGSLAAYTTSIACKDSNGTGATVASSTNAGPLSVPVADKTDIVCIITNTRKTGTVTLLKNVINNNGGTLGANNFGLTVGGNTATSGQAVSVPAGTPVAINEAGAAGYSFVSITGDGCPTTLGGTVTPVANQNITCTITNDDIPATLTVNKVVVNDNGGTKQPQNFQFQVNGGATTAFEADGGNSMIVNAGTYTVTEVGNSAYTTTYSGCSNIVLLLGGSATCTITNNDRPGTLIVSKVLNQVWGGNKVFTDFHFLVNGENATAFENDGSNSLTVNAGDYTVTEQEANASGYVTTYNNCTNVPVANGESATCIITNSDTPAAISGTKFIVNQDLSLASDQSGAQDWTIELQKLNTQTNVWETVNTSLTDTAGNYTFTGIVAGTYQVVETMLNKVTGMWTQLFGNGTSGTTNTTIAVAMGGTYGNNDSVLDAAFDFGNFRNGTVTGTKWNDLNGDGIWQNGSILNEPTLPGWTIFVDTNNNGELDSGEQSAVTNNSGMYALSNLTPGHHRICEVMQAGWVQTYPVQQVNSECLTTLISASGQSIDQVNFGNQGRGSIKVVKNVDTNGDGVIDETNSDAWEWDYGTGNNYATGTNQSVAAGSYVVTEHQQPNYHLTNVSCTGEEKLASAESVTVSVGPGENVVCTYLNTRDTGTVVLKKHVVNNNGGTAVASDFMLHIKQDGTDLTGSPVAGSETGTTVAAVATGEYSVAESMPPSGYAQTGLTCVDQTSPLQDLGSTFDLTKNQTVVCTFTNDDIAPQLTVVKHVDNFATNLTKTASDFTMNVSATNASQSSFAGDEAGTTVTVNAGTYSVSETEDVAYVASYGVDCEGSIAVGEHKTCTITNTAIVNPEIQVVKGGPSMAHEGDTVVYTFTVTNPGNAPLAILDVVDDVAGNGALYQEGDTNEDGWLDPGETWIFSLEYVVPEGQVNDIVNTVTVCGVPMTEDIIVKDQPVLDDELGIVCDDDMHTLDVLRPGLTVVKSGPINAQIGTTGTFTFTVTNTGNTPLSIQTVTDNMAGIGTYQSGDANSNDLLDIDETWVYTAQKLFTANGNVTNTVTVCALDALESEVCNNDNHTTIVYTPQVLGDVAVTKKLVDTGSSVVLATIAAVTTIFIAALVVNERLRTKLVSIFDVRFTVPTA